MFNGTSPSPGSRHLCISVGLRRQGPQRSPLGHRGETVLSADQWLDEAQDTHQSFSRRLRAGRRNEAHSSVVHLSVICWQKSEMPALCRLCSEGPAYSRATLGLSPDSWASTQPDPLPFPPGKQGLWPPAGGVAGGPSGKLRIGGNTRAPSEVLLSFSEIKNESGQSEAEYLASI